MKRINGHMNNILSEISQLESETEGNRIVKCYQSAQKLELTVSIHKVVSKQKKVGFLLTSCVKDINFKHVVPQILLLFSDHLHKTHKGRRALV